MSRTFGKNISNYMTVGPTTSRLGTAINGSPGASVHMFISPRVINTTATLIMGWLNGGITGPIAIICNPDGSTRIVGRSKTSDSGQNCSGITRILPGQWWSIGGVNDFANARQYFYVNGSIDGTNAPTWGSTTFVNTAEPTTKDQIGSGGLIPLGATTTQFDGMIAHVAVWKEALSQGLFRQLAKGVSPLLIKPSSLILYAPFLGSGTESDLSGGGNTFIITGTLLEGPPPPIEHALPEPAPLPILLPLIQKHYRFRSDGGAVDSTPTWGAAEDAGGFDPGTSNFRLRVSVANTGFGAVSPQPFELYVSKNSGAFSAITTTSTEGVQSADASSDADNTVIKVPRLTPGA